MLPASSFDPMPSAARDIIVSNKLGLHARPAMQFVDVANQFT
jgi:phosphotransferase system HPr-like phosphotransfer protein